MEMNVKFILLFVLVVFVVGCSGVKEEVNVEDEVLDNPLSGTCPNGLSCTTPSCGAWVDADNDGACDRS